MSSEAPVVGGKKSLKIPQSTQALLVLTDAGKLGWPFWAKSKSVEDVQMIVGFVWLYPTRNVKNEHILLQLAHWYVVWCCLNFLVLLASWRNLDQAAFLVKERQTWCAKLAQNGKDLWHKRNCIFWCLFGVLSEEKERGWWV